MEKKKKRGGSLKRILAGALLCATVVSNVPVGMLEAEAADVYPVGSVMSVRYIPVGDTVYDPSWTWEHKTGRNYTESGPIEHVEWIKVNVSGTSTTLFAKKAIGNYFFDNRQSEIPTSFGDGLGNGVYIRSNGVRQFLNNTFYNAMSSNFKSKIVSTYIKEVTSQGAKYGFVYDNIYLPSIFELNLQALATTDYYYDEYVKFFKDSNRWDFINSLSLSNIVSSEERFWTRTPVELTNIANMLLGSDSAYLLNGPNDLRYGTGTTSWPVRPVVNLSIDTNVQYIGNNTWKILGGAPEITTSEVPTDWTNEDVTIAAETDKGTLNTGSHTFTENGSFEFIAEDELGNTTSKTVTVDKIDKIAPELNLTASTDPTNKNIVISAIGSDDVSGIKEIVLPDETKETGENATFEAIENGEYAFRVVDNAGNSTIKSITVSNINKVGPTFTISYNDNAQDWTNEDINVTPLAQDKDGTNIVIAPEFKNFTENGSQVFEATDKWGNKESLNVTVTKIDKIAPELILSAGTVPTNRDVNIIIEATDNLSGVKGINLPDGRTAFEATTNYIVPENGTYSFTAIDNAGNKAIEFITISNIDRVAPVITLGEHIKSPTNQDITVSASVDKGTLNTENHTFITNGEFTFIATDEAGNVAEKTVTVDNIDKIVPTITVSDIVDTWTNQDVVVEVSSDKGTLNTTSHTFTTNGDFTFTATDEAGNVAEKTVTVDNIDKVAPELTLTATDEWVKILPITIEVIDNLSGIKAVILPDGKAVISNESIFVAKDNKDYTFKAIDNAGNETVKTITVANTDKVAPTKPSIKLDGNKLILTAGVDSESGIAKHVYSVNSSEWAEITESVDVSGFGNGTFMVKVKAVDNVDNESAVYNYGFILNSRLLDDATSAVEKAEEERTQESVNNAQNKVDRLPEGPEKDALQDRIDAVQDEINMKNEINEATKPEDLDKVQEDIDAVPEGPVKDELQNQLDSKKEELQNKQDAIDAVEKAEEERTQESVDDARDKVNDLPKGPDKTDLNNRLNEVQKEIDKASKLEKDAIEAVERAEKLPNDVLIDDAYAKVNKLPDGPLKDELLGRLDALLGAESVDGKISYKTALRFVQMAEALKRDPHISRAIMFAGRVADEAERAELLARANSVKPAAVDEKALKDAKTAIDAAEKRPSNVSLRLAETKINLLEDSVEKDELLERLNALKNN